MKFYVALDGGQGGLLGPFDTSDEAHTAVTEIEEDKPLTFIINGVETRPVLLPQLPPKVLMYDNGPMGDEEFQLLLLQNVFIKSIFEMGRQAGYAQAANVVV